MKPHALLLLGAIALGSQAFPIAAQSSLPKMVLQMESREGNPADLAGVPEVLAGFFDSRIWGGGGRRRNAWEPNSRDRKFFEETKDFLTGTSAFEIDVSSPLASDHRLFTLTSRQAMKDFSGAEVTILPARIRVDNISTQAAPFAIQEIVFADDEIPQFMRASPTDKLLLVGVRVLPEEAMIPSEVRVFSYASGTLVQVGAVTLPGDSMNPTSCGHVFRHPRDAQFASIQVETPPGSSVWSEARMALVSANFTTETCLAGAIGQTRGLLVLDLQNPGQPFWYDTDLMKQAWDPCRSGGTCDSWFTAGLCHVRALSDESTHAMHKPRDFVYITGGSEIGITRLDLTHVANPAIGIQEEGPFELWPTGQSEGLFAIRADPEDSDLLYVYGRRNAFVVDRKTVKPDPFGVLGPVLYQKSPSDLTFTNAGDTHLVLVDPGAGPLERESWTLARSSADHVLRISDFAQDGFGGLDAPDTSEGRFSVGPTDGAVADFATSSVYCLTFGGVVRWDISGNEPIPVVDSYQPATVGGMTHTTEDLDFADLGPSSGPADWQLIANTADGGLVSWRVNPTTLDPEPAVYHEPPPPLSGDPEYWPEAPGYGNDIDVWDSFGTKWVVLDFSSSKLTTLPHGEIGIGVMRWSDKSWSKPMNRKSIQWSDPGGGPGGWAIEPYVRDLDVDGNCVVAGANGGFITARIPALEVKDYVYTNDINGLEFGRVLGVSLHDDRLFVSLGDTSSPGDPSNHFAFAMYGFNKVNATVVDASGNPTEDPIQILFDGQEFPVVPPTFPPSTYVIDDFPGIFLDGGQQIALAHISANPVKLRLYSGSSNGFTVEIEYDGSTDLMTPKSYWHNGGYFASIAEAKPYLIAKPIGGPGGFGSILGGPTVEFYMRVLVAKTQETFEIVSPPDFQF